MNRFSQAFLNATLGGCSLLALAGCADFMAARQARGEGWRNAVVAQISPGSEITRFSFRDCRKELDPQKAASDKFVVYRYHGAGSAAYHIGLLPSKPLSINDAVSVNIDHCELEPKPRSPD